MIGIVLERSRRLCLSWYQKELFTPTSYLDAYARMQDRLTRRHLAVFAGQYNSSKRNAKGFCQLTLHSTRSRGRHSFHDTSWLFLAAYESEKKYYVRVSAAEFQMPCQRHWQGDEVEQTSAALSPYLRGPSVLQGCMRGGTA